MAKHNDLGKWGEDQACDFLIKKDYTLLARNFRAGKRDVDLIFMTEDTLTVVFVEVKTRRWTDVADPQDAVTRQKMRSVGLAANLYVKANGIEKQLRFDIVSVVGDEEHTPRITHVKYAFNPCLI